MRGRQRRGSLLVVWLWCIAACDPVRVVTETDLFPELRRQLLEDCCRCLAERQIPSKEGRCQERGSETSDEAGADTAIEATPCLCDTDTDGCADALWAGETVTLVGACTQTDGPCDEACGGVLAYP